MLFRADFSSKCNFPFVLTTCPCIQLVRQSAPIWIQCSTDKPPMILTIARIMIIMPPGLRLLVITKQKARIRTPQMNDSCPTGVARFTYVRFGTNNMSLGNAGLPNTSIMRQPTMLKATPFTLLVVPSLMILVPSNIVVFHKR
jgi:hypothetical protein